MHPDDRPSMEHHLLHALGDHTLDLIYAKDRQGCYTFVNSALWGGTRLHSPAALGTLRLLYPGLSHTDE